MARLNGKHRGLESVKDREGKITGWRYRIADATGAMVRGERVWPTIKEAEIDRDRARAAVSEGEALTTCSNWTMADELSAYLAKVEVGTLITRREQRLFARWWTAYLGKQLVEHIRPTHIEKARTLLLKGYRVNDRGVLILPDTVTPRSHARTNRYTDWLRHVLNLARKQGRLKRENPVGLIERYSEVRSTPSPYSPEQIVRLVDALGPYGDWFILAVLTNLRQGNQFALRKSQVLLDQQLIVIPKAKNKKPHFVHLSDRAVAILSAQMAKSPTDCPWVYPGSRHRGHVNARWFYKKIFRPACERAGIQKETTQLWHAARDTFGSLLASQGYREHVLMAAGGWSSQEAVLHYIQIADPVVKEAMDSLSQLVADSIGTVRKLSDPNLIHVPSPPKSLN